MKKLSIFLLVSASACTLLAQRAGTEVPAEETELVFEQINFDATETEEALEEATSEKSVDSQQPPAQEEAPEQKTLDIVLSQEQQQIIEKIQNVARELPKRIEQRLKDIGIDQKKKDLAKKVGLEKDFEYAMEHGPETTKAFEAWNQSPEARAFYQSNAEFQKLSMQMVTLGTKIMQNEGFESDEDREQMEDLTLKLVELQCVEFAKTDSEHAQMLKTVSSNNIKIDRAIRKKFPDDFDYIERETMRVAVEVNQECAREIKALQQAALVTNQE